ncbi:MAG: TatD family hydrolase [Candidatus Magasanikbacteria bacterium]|nr:TatD family hydrolase [Candidatus Magasanikbacteria bacterium]NCS72261.1 TatD family hydrolase [Candidatus Magasanikbacteria bacterium]
MIIDTHCHIQFKAFDEDRNEVLKRCQEKNIIMNAVGTQQTTSQLAVALAEQHENIYATIGLHPIQEHKVQVEEEQDNFMSRGEVFDIDYYDKLARHPKVIAIGETGLDKYHIPKDKTQEDIFAVQKDIFLQHIKLANKHDLPLVIHIREAHEEMIALLSEIKQKGITIKGVVHCFTGNWTQAQIYLDAGLYLGFTGVVTFPPKKTDPKPQEELQEVIKNIPLDRILVETDAPYLAPQAHRGKRSEPWMTEEVVKWISEYRNISQESLMKQTVDNTKALFTKIK